MPRFESIVAGCGRSFAPNRSVWPTEAEDSRGGPTTHLSSKQSLISVIDDDQPCRESMRRLIRSLGYTVDVFSSAAEFLASPCFIDTACLITDAHMPAMTGLEPFRHLMPAGHRIPTILVTAYPSDADRARALKDGVICYLRKPLDERDLSRCLSAALAGREPQIAS